MSLSLVCSELPVVSGVRRALALFKVCGSFPNIFVLVTKRLHDFSHWMKNLKGKMAFTLIEEKRRRVITRAAKKMNKK